MNGLTIAAVGIGFVMGTCYVTGLRCNTTPSMPLGVWRVRSIDAPIVRGEIVTLCLDPDAAALGRERGYLTGGECPGNVELLIKSVAAIPGDKVKVTDGGIEVNGVPIPNTSPLPFDDLKRPLQAVAQGLYRVGPDQVWVIGATDIRSYDSRYYGAVPMASLRGQAQPLFVNQ